MDAKFAWNQPAACQGGSIQPRFFGRNISNIQCPPAESLQGAKDSTTTTAVKATGDGPQECPEYSAEIDVWTRVLESRYCASANYMSAQPDINEKMRAILVDWMVDVHLKFGLSHETLFLAVSTLDRYLSREPVTSQRLQLVGITAMLIASKVEEVYPPEVKDLVYIADNSYTKEEVIETEKRMLAALEFEMSPPSSLRFLTRFSKHSGADLRTHNLAMYLTELALVEYRFVRHRPSLCAAAALYLATRLLDKTVAWDHSVGNTIGYKEAAVKPCARELAAIMHCAGKSSLQAVRRKYALPIYMNVSAIRTGKRE